MDVDMGTMYKGKKINMNKKIYVFMADNQPYKP
jgi:hypothetical protein